MCYSVDATHMQQQHCKIFPHSRRNDQVLMCTFVSLVHEINWILVPGFLKRLLFNKSDDITREDSIAHEVSINLPTPNNTICLCIFVQGR